MRKEVILALILLTGCNNLILDKVPIKDITIKESTKPVEVKESVKPSVLPSIKPSTVSNSTGQDQILNNNQNPNIQSSTSVVIATPKPIPTSTSLPPNNSTNLTGNIEPKPTPTPLIIPELELIRVDNPNGEVSFYKPANSQKPYKVWYPIPETPLNKVVSISFVDEYRVRYNKEKKEFYSLLNIDLSDVNNLFKNYKLEVFPEINGLVHLDYFEQLDKIGMEQDSNYISIFSQYTLQLEDKTKIKELILKMREIKFFRYTNSESVIGIAY